MSALPRLPEIKDQKTIVSSVAKNRSGYSRVVIAVFGGVLVMFFGTFLLLHLRTPFDGARLQPGQSVWQAFGVTVTPIQEQKTPDSLQKGDVVIAVAGQSMEVWAQALFRLNVNRPQWQVGQTVEYIIIRDDQQLQVPVTLGQYPLFAVARQNWGTIVYALVYMVVGTYVFLRRPDNRAAKVMFIAAASIVSSTTWSFGLQISDIVGGVGFWLYKLTSLGVYTLFWIANLHFALIFPRPLPLISKRPWLIFLLYLLPFVWIFGFIVAVWPMAISTLEWLSRWIIAEGIAAAVLLILTLVGIGWQYRTNSTGATRQQIRWVVWGALLVGGFGLIFYILPGALGLEQMNPNLMGIIMVIFPLGVAVAIVRHNLFDIDTILNRTLIYGTLTVSTMGLYIFLVGYVGNLFQVGNRSFLAFLVTGLVAVLFQPLRERLRRLVNRFMYGERDDPAAVLSKLGQRLEATIAPGAVLPGIVETVAQTLKLPYVAIETEKSDGYRIEAAYGLATDETVRLPLVYRAETIGFLVVSPRASDEPLNSADKQLLENIAHQAGSAVHAVQLTTALQKSRQRLVTAREEERRRLRRDLHDGLGPHLASQMLTIDAIGKLLKRDPAQAESLLQDLKHQSQTAITDIRRLVYDLRPPALDDLGLVAALREGARHYQQSGLRIDIDAPERLPPLPAAVEVAAYRIAQEALTNVVRHAQAGTCHVRLSLNDYGHGQGLLLQVEDDGQGLPADHRAGVGCQAMRERATELGGHFVIESQKSGGTQVSAWLPLLEEDV